MPYTKLRPIEFHQDFALVVLTQGKKAKIDLCDVELIGQYNWHYSKGYAVRRGEDGNMINMHREINQTPEGLDTDHINLDALDNRRENLRSASRSENKRNTCKRAGGSSLYKGVSIDKENIGRWISSIRYDGKRKHLGRFPDEVQAAKAYDIVALKIFGKFARINSYEDKI